MPAVMGTSISWLASRATCRAMPVSRASVRTCSFQPESVTTVARRSSAFRRRELSLQRSRKRKLPEIQSRRMNLKQYERGPLRGAGVETGWACAAAGCGADKAVTPYSNPGFTGAAAAPGCAGITGREAACPDSAPGWARRQLFAGSGEDADAIAATEELAVVFAAAGETEAAARRVKSGTPFTCHAGSSSTESGSRSSAARVK